MRRLEKSYPLVGSAVALVALWQFLPPTILKGDPKDLFAGVLNVAAIAVGFLVTTKSILISMEGRRSVKQIRSAGLYDDLVDYLVHATRSAFMLAVLCVVGLLLKADVAGWGKWYLLATAGVGVHAGLSCYRVLDVFAAVLRITEKRDT